jgi:hypothetical protein
MSRHHKRWFTLKQEAISTAASVFKMVVLNGDHSPRRQSIVPVNQVFLNAHLDMYLEKYRAWSLGIVLPCEIPPITLALAEPLALEAYEVLSLLLAYSRHGIGVNRASNERGSDAFRSFEERHSRSRQREPHWSPTLQECGKVRKSCLRGTESLDPFPVVTCHIPYRLPPE